MPRLYAQSRGDNRPRPLNRLLLNMADKNASGNTVQVDLLHPEILSIDILLGILKERKVSESELDDLDKYKLVELYYDHVMPLPQRIYGDGRRERRLAKLRNGRELMKRKSESGTDNEDGKSKKICFGGSNSLKCAGRLKPSPSDSCRNEIIKLTNSGSLLNDNQSSSLSVEDMASSKNISPTKKRKFQPISWP